MYWLDAGSMKLERATLYGTHRNTIHEGSDLQNAKNLAIDHQENALYWTCAGRGVWRMLLANNEVKQVTTFAMQRIMGLAVYRVSNMVTSHRRWGVSPSARPFVAQLIQANIKRNIKVSHHWPFTRGMHRWLIDSPLKGAVMRKAPWTLTMLILRKFLKFTHPSYQL